MVVGEATMSVSVPESQGGHEPILAENDNVGYTSYCYTVRLGHLFH